MSSDLALTADLGKPVEWDIALTRNGEPLSLPDGTKLWLTAKLNPSDLDSAALFQLTVGAGITILDTGDGHIRARVEAAQTAAASDLTFYYIELQTLLPEEDPDIPDNGRGTLTFTRPITGANA